ncbi:GIY-YIG nuclease family protein [Candidatus Uhrbacteria bacterium]|jgi:putative endonuclease|nr:GIY-YIG nuclease family protein [Candidatus Uhrbacteria bacterium]
MKSWYVYIVKCADETLYTGVAVDLAKRIKTHNEGKGAKYTRARLPVKLQWSEKLENESLAKKREAEIKKWSRKAKLNFLKTESK